MISFVRGTLSAVTENSVEMDTGSFGFEIFVPTSVLDRLPPVGEDTELYTHLNVKEDEMSLYGFQTKDEREMFRLLITVSGIGPKGALGILSVMSPTDLRFAILSGDAKTISKSPGIGPKTAQRMIIELKDKVDLESSVDGFRAENAGNDASKFTEEEAGAKSDAILVLTALGYSNSDALRAVQYINPSGKSAEEIVKEALKKLGS